MAITTNASYSHKPFFQGLCPDNSVVYAAPTNTASVTAGTATAIIRELIICNRNSTQSSFGLIISGTHQVFTTVKVNPNETLIITDLNIMLNAGDTVTLVNGGTFPIYIYVTMSGWEVQ